jgi:hypothetical protein
MTYTKHIQNDIYKAHSELLYIICSELNNLKPVVGGAFSLFFAPTATGFRFYGSNPRSMPGIQINGMKGITITGVLDGGGREQP